MELDYLREFVILASLCHYQRAAEVLFVSQSSLSKHIRAIEDDLGMELLTRTTRKVELSDFGKKFLPYAQQISKIQTEYIQLLLQPPMPENTIISIGVSGYTADFSLRGALIEFYKIYSRYRISVLEYSDEVLRASLRSKEIEVAIAMESSKFNDNEFEKVFYCDDYLALILPDGHPLLNEIFINYSHLKDYKLIVLGDINYLEMIDSRLKATYFVNREDRLFEMVSQGMGLAIMPYYFTIRKKKPGISSFILKDVPKLNINMLYNKGQKLSEPIKYLLSCARCN